MHALRYNLQEMNDQDEQTLKRKRSSPQQIIQSNQSIDEQTLNTIEHDELLGQTVSGVLNGSFDAGYFLTLKPQNSHITLTGLVFCPEKVLPITPQIDLAPSEKMYHRISSVNASMFDEQSEQGFDDLECYRTVEHDEIMKEFEASACATFDVNVRPSADEYVLSDVQLGNVEHSRTERDRCDDDKGREEMLFLNLNDVNKKSVTESLSFTVGELEAMTSVRNDGSGSGDQVVVHEAAVSSELTLSGTVVSLRSNPTEDLNDRVTDA